MITTRIQLQFNKNIIKVRVPDSIFSALRGPDSDHEGVVKALGSTIVRQYLVSYTYGFQSTFAEALGASAKSMTVDVPDNWNNYWNALCEELPKTNLHYVSHTYQALVDLAHTLFRASRLNMITREEIKLDVLALRGLARFWSEVSGYLRIKSPNARERYLVDIQQHLKNLILFVADKSEWTEGHQYFQCKQYTCDIF